jgi:predicted dehydrogenase/threonine dehydrogenase-like Zn-dependent dehydrogenase
MRQVFSKRGQVIVENVPLPLCGPGGVLVRTAWSLLSAGTERTNISGQRVVDRLRRQPEVVGKVLSEVRRAGLSETVKLVTDKMERPIQLGNSLSGVVVEVGTGVPDLAVGDRVACGGTGHASHAEYVFVPRNLTVTVPDGLHSKDAAFVTLGAIALQGVRRATLQLGETAVVVGLGLIGLLTVQILRAAGVRVVGIDPLKERAILAERLGAGLALVAGEGNPVAAVLAATGGVGADAVLLTAATPSSEPVNQAFEMARQKGRVVIVGDVGLQLSRPTFYNKELDLVISRSTGPGRYDPSYEEHGLDYPLAYVRWTERRNMEEFLRLAADGGLRLSELIGGEFSVEDAPLAYEALEGAGRGVALLLQYTAEPAVCPARSVSIPRTGRARPGALRVAVIGAGQFARQTLLPRLVSHRDVTLRAIVGGSSGTGLHDARRFGAHVYATDAREVLDDPEVDAVIIATRHHLHAPLAIEAARQGKAVFVEKPLALTLEDCRAVVDAVTASGTVLTVGFNRRFAPLAGRARQALVDAAGPATAVYRINAGALPPDHWLLDPVHGGGRIVGEGCHFFDLLCWLLDEEPVAVHAMAPADAGDSSQQLSVTLRFSRGSVGTVVYTANGHPSLPKERLEVFKGGRALVLDDFRVLTVNGTKTRRWSADKGYDAEVTAFLRAVRGESPLAVTVLDGVRATAVALRAIEAAATATRLAVDWRGCL